MGETLLIYLPKFSDADLDDSHTKVVQEEGLSSLPSFISYSSSDFSLKVEPKMSVDAGEYDIEVILTDSDSVNSGEQLSIFGTFTIIV